MSSDSFMGVPYNTSLSTDFVRSMPVGGTRTAILILLSNKELSASCAVAGVQIGSLGFNREYEIDRTYELVHALYGNKF